MNQPFIISEKATEDLEQIWLYTYFHWSVNQADKYYGFLIKQIQFIARNQTVGHKIDDVKEGYRCYSADSHIIFYTISENDTVRIIRILGQNQDLPNRLLE